MKSILYIITVVICILFSSIAIADEYTDKTCIGSQCFVITEAKNVKVPSLREEGFYSVDIFEKECYLPNAIAEMHGGLLAVSDGADGIDYTYADTKGETNFNAERTLTILFSYVPQKFGKRLYTSGEKVNTSDLKRKFNKMLSENIKDSEVKVEVTDIEVIFHGLTQLHSRQAQYYTYNVVMESTSTTKPFLEKVIMKTTTRSIVASDCSRSLQEHKTEVMASSENVVETITACKIIEGFINKETLK